MTTQSKPATPLRDTRTPAERDFHSHMGRWGSDGYPIRKVSNGWIWDEFCGVKGAPVIYKTKKSAFSAIDTYLGILCDKAAGRV